MFQSLDTLKVRGGGQHQSLLVTTMLEWEKFNFYIFYGVAVLLCRATGVESDEGSDASSDGENESLMGPGRSQWQGRVLKDADSSSSYSALGSGPRLERSTFVNGDDEDVEVWSYFETSPPYSRVPLVDKVGHANIYSFSRDQLSSGDNFSLCS
jgi:hypothetical protein